MSWEPRGATDIPKECQVYIEGMLGRTMDEVVDQRQIKCAPGPRYAVLMKGTPEGKPDGYFVVLFIVLWKQGDVIWDCLCDCLEWEHDAARFQTIGKKFFTEVW